MMSRKLGQHHNLSDEDRAQFAALPFVLRRVSASDYLVRESQVPEKCAFVVQGYTYRQKLTVNGERQIVSMQIPGDFIDLQNLFLRQSDHNVQALTNGLVAEIAIPALQRVVLTNPAIGKALWIATLIEASMLREWLLNIGRRGAPARLAHLLCEMAVRMKQVGMPIEDSYELPMTQEQIGDALGLTSVHVNRVLRELDRRGLISRSKRRFHVSDWDGLRQAADFNERYLHLDQC